MTTLKQYLEGFEKHPLLKDAPKNRNEGRIKTDDEKTYSKSLDDKAIYKTYVNTQLKKSQHYTKEKLDKYFTAYVKLSKSMGKFSGSDFVLVIKKIFDSKKKPDEKFLEFEKVIKDSVKTYNKAHSSEINKRIKL